MEGNTAERTIRQKKTQEQNKKEWATSVGLCQKHKPQHPHTGRWARGDEEGGRRERGKRRTRRKAKYCTHVHSSWVLQFWHRNPQPLSAAWPLGFVSYVQCCQQGKWNEDPSDTSSPALMALAAHVAFSRAPPERSVVPLVTGKGHYQSSAGRHQNAV